MSAFFIFLNTPILRVVWKAQLALALFIYCYCAWSTGVVTTASYPDWLMHFIGNIFLYGSFWWAFFYTRIAWQLLAALVPFSLAVELGQALTPQRMVSLMDMLANICGLVSAFLIARRLQAYVVLKPNETNN